MVPARFVHLLQKCYVFQVISALQVFMDNILSEGIGLKIGALLYNDESADNLLVCQGIRHPQPGSYGLGKAAEINEMLCTSELKQGWKSFPFEHKFSVRVIFNYKEIMIVYYFHQLQASFQGQGRPRGILEIRHKIDEL